MSRKQNLHSSFLLSVHELAEKAKLYAKSAKAPSTIRAYRSDWIHFETWCRLHRLKSLKVPQKAYEVLQPTRLTDLQALQPAKLF